jgi:hypothetical protein
MDQLPSESLLELVHMAEASIDVQFQVWLTITFAVIVASFASQGQPSIRIRGLMIALYVLAVAALYARWMTDGSRLVPMLDELLSRGIDAYPTAWIAPILRIATFIGGTGIAVYLMIHFHKKEPE